MGESRISGSVDQKSFRKLSRRSLLKLSPVLALGAFAVPAVRDELLSKGLALTDWASAQWFRREHLAQVYANSELTPFEKFPLNDYDVDDPEVDLEEWKLQVSGAVARAGEYKLAQIQALPLVRQNTRHICVEGWEAIGRFGGARISDFLNLIGTDPTAKYLYIECTDDYYVSIDMNTARHAQSLLCYEMYDRPLTREHGAPLRLSIPTKVGYKHAKYITDFKVTHVLEKAGYWEDQGYSSYYGL